MSSQNDWRECQKQRFRSFVFVSHTCTANWMQVEVRFVHRTHTHTRKHIVCTLVSAIICGHCFNLANNHFAWVAFRIYNYLIRLGFPNKWTAVAVLCGGRSRGKRTKEKNVCEEGGMCDTASETHSLATYAIWKIHLANNSFYSGSSTVGSAGIFDRLIHSHQAHSDSMKGKLLAQHVERRKKTFTAQNLNEFKYKFNAQQCSKVQSVSPFFTRFSNSFIRMRCGRNG